MDENQALHSNSSSESNIIIRLWEGEVPLPITYWIYWVLIGGFGFAFVGVAVQINYMELLLMEDGELLIDSFFWTAIAYTAFMVVAVWRSAGRHTGSQFWAGAARVVVIFGGLAILVQTAMKLGLMPATETDIQSEVRSMNLGLPAMIDDLTRMDRVEADGSSIRYLHTLIGVDHTSVDSGQFEREMKSIIVPGVCSTKSIASLMRNGRRLEYVYRDPSGIEVGKVSVAISDCE